MLRGKALLTTLARITPKPFPPLDAARAVPLVKFTEYVQTNGRPNLLFMSGEANRYNLRKTLCLYVSETKETARTELRYGMDGIDMDEAVFTVRCDLARVLDLTDEKIRGSLRLSEEQLFAPWETARRATDTQRLGELVLNGTLFDAIRFPSNAMRHEKKTGVNLVIGKRAALDPTKITVQPYGRSAGA